MNKPQVHLTCSFDIIFNGPDRIVIKDTNGLKSVTNDAENLVKAFVLLGYLPNREKRLFYYDSDGNCDEILHDGEEFVAFSLGE